MQLNLQHPDSAFSLRGADGSCVRVNDRTLHRSCIVVPDRLIEQWPVTSVIGLSAIDLEPLLALKPELILLGTGETQVFPAMDVIGACLTRGIGIEAMANDAAARTFNVLASESRRVVAGFILAC